MLVRKFLAVLVFAAVAPSGCVFSEEMDQSSAELKGRDDFARSARDRQEVDAGECVKIEGSEIGRLGLTLSVGDVELTFVDWIVKEDSPGEFIGFELESTGSIPEYVVKAGADRFAGNSTRWVHPNGTTGPQAHAISNIEFCDDGDDSDDCPGGDDCSDDGDDCPDSGGDCSDDTGDCPDGDDHCSDDGDHDHDCPEGA